MVDWVARAALRNYQAVERSKYKKINRFSDRIPIGA